MSIYVGYCGSYNYFKICDRNGKFANGFYSYDNNDKPNILLIGIGNIPCAAAHLCNIKKFKCDSQNCTHKTNGNVALMTIRNCFSRKKYYLNFLNEIFVKIDYLDWDDDLIQERSFVSCNEHFKNMYSHTIIYCEICKNRYKYMYKNARQFCIPY